MTRQEYDQLLIKAGHAIHLLGCIKEVGGEACTHETYIWSAECMMADAVLQVWCDAQSFCIPPEGPGGPVWFP